jgi:hypothetical protein
VDTTTEPDGWRGEPGMEPGTGYTYASGTLLARGTWYVVADAAKKWAKENGAVVPYAEWEERQREKAERIKAMNKEVQERKLGAGAALARKTGR